MKLLEESGEIFKGQKEALQNKQRKLELMISCTDDLELREELKTYLAYLYDLSGHYGDAEALLQDVLNQLPDNLTAKYFLCQIQISQHKYADSIEMARSLYRNSTSLTHLNLLIRALWNSKQKDHIEEAYGLARTAIESYSTRTESWYRLCKICQKLQRKREARWAAEQGLQTASEVTANILTQGKDAYYRALLAQILKRRQEARYWAQLAWEIILDMEILAPYGMYVGLGDLLSRLGFGEEAEQCLQQGCALNFRQTGPLLAGHYVRRGKIRKAWEVLRSLIRFSLKQEEG